MIDLSCLLQCKIRIAESFQIIAAGLYIMIVDNSVHRQPMTRGVEIDVSFGHYGVGRNCQRRRSNGNQSDHRVSSQWSAASARRAPRPRPVAQSHRFTFPGGDRRSYCLPRTPDIPNLGNTIVGIRDRDEFRRWLTL